MRVNRDLHLSAQRTFCQALGKDDFMAEDV